MVKSGETDGEIMDAEKILTYLLPIRKHVSLVLVSIDNNLFGNMSSFMIFFFFDRPRVYHQITILVAYTASY